MSDLERYLQLKSQVESAKQQADKAEGALESELKQMKKDFGCDTIEDAKRQLRQYKVKRDKIKAKFDREMERFEKKWKDKL